MKGLQYRGTEFDWFAVDQESHIAWFISAGSGMIPDIVFRFENQLRILNDYFFTKIDRNNPRRLHPDLKCQPEWVSEQGIYVYEAEVMKFSHYTRIASPQIPVSVSRFPDDISNALKSVRLNLSFVKDVVLYPNMLGIESIDDAL